MPELNISQHHLTQRETLFYIEAVMLWPGDETMREAAYGIPTVERLATYLRDSGASVPATEAAYLIAQALSFPSREHVRAEAERLAWHGHCAGAILSRLLYASDASLRDSIRSVVADLAGKLHQQRIGERTINAWWPAYRPVAHLWAATATMSAQHGSHGVPCRLEDLPAFLALAERNRREGEALQLRQSRDHATALPAGETWRVPASIALPTVEVTWQHPA